MSDQTAPRPRRQLPKVQFRVLIAGRANAGKTTILQRVCDTTESPETYRMVDGERTKVESKTSCTPLHIVLMGQQIQLIPTSDRGEHDITDELEFSNHDGYVFHDSCGLENGSTKELKTLQDFVRNHAEKKTLAEQLHVIWYCIPMDDHRPGLNVDPLNALQIDKNVPVIAVFTKWDAFRRNMRMDLEDDEQAGDDLDRLTDQRCEEIFQRECLDKIGDTTPFVLLEGMNDPAAHCDELIQTTAEALDSGTVTLMLLAVQTKNLELSVQRAVQESLKVFNVEPSVLMKGGFMKKIKKAVTKTLARGPSKSLKVEDVVKECLKAFPWLWASLYARFDLDLALALDVNDDAALDLDLAGYERPTRTIWSLGI
ncbi:hypothetical protein C8F04DRAFT_1197805 [Mycena alexandri]|uniref:G domain-containing protein n=1 Tax=Mycena alexandri TaxID=1745969 RepID=A0AAD6S2K3_9AGAR|nr:hypothetical protein C8F04DRAFT_1197805 [Mycena alexandri]